MKERTREISKVSKDSKELTQNWQKYRHPHNGQHRWNLFQPDNLNGDR
jgi:hypothetical protein